MTASTHNTDQARADVRLPADGAFVSVLRTMAAGLAARADFTLDDIEDLRMTVGEAAALLVEQARPDGALEASFSVGPRRIQVVLRVESVPEARVDQGSFAWQVLTALAEDVTLAAPDSPGSAFSGSADDRGGEHRDGGTLSLSWTAHGIDT